MHYQLYFIKYITNYKHIRKCTIMWYIKLAHNIKGIRGLIWMLAKPLSITFTKGQNNNMSTFQNLSQNILLINV